MLKKTLAATLSVVVLALTAVAPVKAAVADDSFATQSQIERTRLDNAGFPQYAN